MDLSQFPFDFQHCSLEFTTQNMPTSLIYLRIGESRLAQYSTHNMTMKDGIYSQWRLLSLHGNEFLKTFNDSQSGYVNHFSYIVFLLSVERIPTFYEYNVALPSCILTLISLWVFWLPPESGERVSESYRCTL